jgi:hypothetical protein
MEMEDEWGSRSEERRGWIDMVATAAMKKVTDTLGCSHSSSADPLAQQVTMTGNGEEFE